MAKISKLSQADVAVASRNSWRCKSFFGPMYCGSPLVIERSRGSDEKTSWIAKWENSVIDDKNALVYDPAPRQRHADHIVATRLDSLQAAFDRADNFIDAVVHDTLRDARLLAAKHIPADDFGMSSSFNEDGQHVITVYVKSNDAAKKIENALQVIGAIIAVVTTEEPEEETKESER